MKDTEVKKRIEYFEKRVRYYFFEVFHLYEYALEIYHDAKNEDDSLAWCGHHDLKTGAGRIDIHYTDILINDSKWTLETLDKVAYHEVCEALLSELRNIINERFLDASIIPNALHRVIKRLENIHYPIVKDAKK